MKKVSHQHGFTLIELIIVISILGILAAFALPRFADLSSDARRATLNGALASARAGAAIAHSAQLAGGLGAGVSVMLEGQPVTMINRYPTADANGIVMASQLSSDFDTTSAGGVLTVRVAGAPTPADCSFTYTAAGAGLTPTFGTPNTAGC